MAVAVADLGIAVSALASEIAPEDARQATWPRRIVSYRPDRYGLQLEDLQSAEVLEIRLTASRDAAGQFAYSLRQMQRWLGEEGSAKAATATPALHWHPELRSLSDLPRKVDQLRRLAPQAECFASIGPFRLTEEIAALVASGVDGVILRLDDCGALTAAETAQLVVLARQRIARQGREADFPLWIVPPVDPTADDCVKLIALGATAVAVDAWCNALLMPTVGDRTTAWSDAALGPLKPSSVTDPLEHIGPDLDRLAGLIHSCGVTTAASLHGGHLTTADQHLAVQLGIGWLLAGLSGT